MTRAAPARLVAILGLALVAGCEPTTPPPGAGTGGSASPLPSGLEAGKPTVTVTGNAVQIVGLGTGTTPQFDLPAGSAEIKLGKCSSNQVSPFVQMYDESNSALGFIVEEVNEVTNLAGGKYYLAVQANPDCVWTIDVTPK